MSTHQIISMKRGSTSGSSSPMWRCDTADGQRVNVFKHEKPERNTFALFEKAGYATEMLAMQLDDVLTWETHVVTVTMMQSEPDAKGTRWWNVVTVEQRPADAQPDPRFNPDPALARKAARAWAELVTDPLLNYLIVDTETTDKDPLRAEIVSIAVINAAGDTLLNSLVKPRNPERLLTNGSVEINGITPALLEHAPTFAEIYKRIYEVLGGQHILIFNAEYDWTVLEREAMRMGVMPLYAASVTCAMEMFAVYHGEWNAQRQVWQSKGLQYAAEYVGVDAINAHDALGDCLTTLRVIQAMCDSDSNSTDEI